MPAGVIDISKYAMADRSQRVLVRTTATLPTPARTTNASASLYRAIHPYGVSGKIQFGKSSRSTEELDSPQLRCLFLSWDFHTWRARACARFGANPQRTIRKIRF